VRLFGAFAGDALVGVVGYEREPRAKGRHKATVLGMFVPAEHAGHGVGGALMAALIAAARDEPGLEHLVLTVTATNTRALRLYERCGFESFGTEPRAIRVGSEYFGKTHMILFLDRP
jgi:RimJ/RimL family protein N-acetyltransferase